MDDIRWEDNRKRIREYWPSAQFGAEGEHNELRDLWHRTLSPLNQRLLSEALEAMKLKYASHQPEIRWVHQCYDEIVERRRLKPTGPTQQPDTWFCDWSEPSRLGPWQTNYSAPCRTLDDAQRLAVSKGGRARSLRSDFGEVSGHHLAESDERVLATLRTHPRETLAAGISRLRAQGFLSAAPLVADIAQWNRMVRALVWARIDIDAATPQKAAAS